MLGEFRESQNWNYGQAHRLQVTGKDIFSLFVRGKFSIDCVDTNEMKIARQSLTKVKLKVY